MIFGFDFPDFLSGRGIQHVDVRSDVAKINSILGRAFSFHGPDADRGTHARVRLIGPIDTTGLRVDGINGSSIYAEEYTPSRDGGLAVNFFGARKAECPL